MKSNVVNFLSVAILAAQSLFGLSAQEVKPTEELPTFPMQASFIYPITTQGAQTVNYRYHLSFGLLSSKVGAVYGIGYSSLFNQVEHDVIGIQFGGLCNVAQKLKGIQYGGLANISGDVTGIQFAGIANIADSVQGIQFGGIANLSNHKKGLQFGGIANITDKSEGLQFAGITNISDEASGISFAGIINRTGTLRGVQFGGIVNVIDTIESGVSVALINIVKKNFYNEWSLTFADYLNAGLSYKMGTQKFYTIFTAGAHFVESQVWTFGIKQVWAFGLGFGNCTPLNSRFDFQPEIVGYRYFPNDFKNIQTASSTHLKLGFVYKLNKKLGIVAAPSIYHFNCHLDDIWETHKISPIKEFYSKKHDNYLYTFGAGFSVGLVLR
jgi:hypothetical protein